MQSRPLAKVLAVLALGVGALGASTAARADSRVSLHIGVGVPLGGVYVQPAPQPIYVQPAPVVGVPHTIYAQPQVVYTQPHVYYAPAPVVYPRGAVYVGGPVYRSGFHGGHGHRGHGHGHHKGHKHHR